MVQDEFETVIVGGGTAGCVLAGLLAERGDGQILLLEAGHDYGPRDAGGWPRDLLDPRSFLWTHEWGYDSGDTYSDRRVPFYRARVLGGCSAHNSCQAVWGHAADYDAWSALGLDGWSARDLERAFQEANRRTSVATVGPAEMSPFSNSFLEASCALGYELVDDLTSLQGGPGAARIPKNIVDGVRWNAAFAYLDAMRDRVQVVSDALVERVALDGDRARGVWFRVADGSRFVSAERIIVASGVYGSPAVLLRSGVGPADELRALGIQAQLELDGVGRNLHDHPQIELIYDGSAGLHEAMRAWSEANPQPISEQVLLKACSSRGDEVFDLHIWANGGFPLATGWQGGLPFEGDTGTWQWEIGVSCLTPRARGTVRLRSAHPEEPPLIDHRYLCDQDGHDERVLLDGIEIARRLALQRQARWWGAELPPTAGALSPVELSSVVRANCVHYWHPVGTCRMGTDADAGAVVDSSGRVHGIHNLYVADASIMPIVPRGNTNIPTVALAHRIADTLQPSR